MTHNADFWDVFADFYDDYYDEESIPDDTEFYVELAQEADGPVLEVGCGTGRIYLELLRAGVDAYGIDVSQGMLDVLHDRATEEDLTPHVRTADMRTFEPKRDYSLIIVPFRSFLHNITLEDQKAALRRFHQALRSEGRLALNFFTPNFEVICEEYGEPDVRTIERGGETYRLEHLSEIEDAVDQVVRGTQTITKGGEVIQKASYRITLISKREFEVLLETTGWSDWEVYGGFDYEPLDDASQEMVWIVER